MAGGRFLLLTREEVVIIITMNIFKIILTLSIPAIIMTACAARNVLDVSWVDAYASPAQVRNAIEEYKDRTVQWGGLIVNVIKEETDTVFLVLSYPLHENGEPDDHLQPSGLFYFFYRGEKDISNYLPGRLLTVVGDITGERGHGDKEQVLPMVEGGQIYL